MASSCRDCRTKLAKHKYWQKLPLTKHQFFKVLLKDFEHQLSIPRKFVKCFRGKISKCCKLKGPSGNEWRVKTIKTQNDTLFADGWEKFARDHRLKTTDFLVFSYIKESTFYVSHFDFTGCEVETSYFAKNMSCCNNRSESESDLHGHALEYYGSDDEGSPYEESDDQTTQQSPPRIKSSSSKATQRQVYYTSNRRQVTQEEKDKAYFLAEKFVIKNQDNGVPTVAIRMLRSHVYIAFHPTIPKKWAVQHMLREPHDVELHVPGVENTGWVIGCRWSTTNMCQFTSNWPKFVLENKLEEHDVCVFELVEKRPWCIAAKAVFNVHIFRVVEEPVPVTVKRRNK